MIAYLVALTLLSWAGLWPMLRPPRRLPRVPTIAFAVPNTTFDSRGLV